MTPKQEALKLALEALEFIPESGSLLGSQAETKRLQAITAIREALAEQPAQQQQVNVPVTDNTYGYAKSLAEAIFKQHFASDEHYASGRIVWGVNDTVIGILTQIDNMVADMVRRPAQQQEPHGWYIDGYGAVLGASEPKSVRPGEWLPFYTSPQPSQPSKPWVGLTEDEKTEIRREHYARTLPLMDAVEAKLREKNNE